MVSSLTTLFCGTLESGEILWHSRWVWKSKTLTLIPLVHVGGTHCHYEMKIEGLIGKAMKQTDWSKKLPLFDY